MSRNQAKPLREESVYSWIPATEELSKVISKFEVTCLPARAQNPDINREMHTHDFFLYRHLLGRSNHDTDALQSAWTSYVEDNEMQQNQRSVLQREWFESPMA